MDQSIDIIKSLKQHLEIDSFLTGDFALRGEGLPVEDALSTNSTEVASQNLEQVQVEYTYKKIDANMNKKDAVALLKELSVEIEKCRACQLGNTRINPVIGEGSVSARIVFVGEAPGAKEDETGKPFVGRSGQLLTKIIEAMNLSRQEVYICNTIKCRPPENRDPKPQEKKACRHFLNRQLEIIKPEIIVALGSHAAKSLLDVDKPIGQLRGKLHDFYMHQDAEPIKLMPTYHPSYLLRNYNYESRKRVWQDMQSVLKYLNLPVPTKNPAQK